jgi:hypothetical protein
MLAKTINRQLPSLTTIIRSKTLQQIPFLLPNAKQTFHVIDFALLRP